MEVRTAFNERLGQEKIPGSMMSNKRSNIFKKIGETNVWKIFTKKRNVVEYFYDCFIQGYSDASPSRQRLPMGVKPAWRKPVTRIF